MRSLFLPKVLLGNSGNLERLNDKERSHRKDMIRNNPIKEMIAQKHRINPKFFDCK
jgi:hypothetical protein